MLTTIFFLFCVLHKRKHCPYANSRKRGRGTTLTTSRRHDRSGAAAAERGLVFYYKLTAFDRSWLIHWKLKKVSPSFFLFFLSPYIRLGMNQVVLFFFFASERAKLKWAEARAMDLLCCPTYFASHILLYWTPSVCLSSFALRSRKEIYFLSTTNNLKVKVLELIIKDTNITKLIIFPCLNLITTEKSEA